MLIESLPGVFARRLPEAGGVPVLFDIPRSGAEYPRDFASIADLAALQRSVSAYLEDLYGEAPAAGAGWLFACFPNVYIDPNRHVLDLDPEALDGVWPEALQPSDKSRRGIGLIPTICGGTQPIYAGKLPVADARHRVEAYYRPYHAELARLLAEMRARHGTAFHLSCHSMTSVVEGKRRSDFDLGDRHGTTCAPELVELVETVLRGFGYHVTRNAHFIGAECVRQHGDPQHGIHSLQIEMNRDLYMDEASRRRGPGYGQVRAHMAQLAQALAAHARQVAPAR